MLSKRALEVLRVMADEDEEFVADGLSCWVGDGQTSRSTLRVLLQCMALSDVSDVKGIERYAINSTGRQILTRPELAGEVLRAMIEEVPFQVVDCRIVPMGPEGLPSPR